jgi:hypothetical protein
MLRNPRHTDLLTPPPASTSTSTLLQLHSTGGQRMEVRMVAAAIKSRLLVRASSSIISVSQKFIWPLSLPNRTIRIFGFPTVDSGANTGDRYS